MVLDRTYSVRWYGPFGSVEEVKKFEDKHDTEGFQLYIINGYKPYTKRYDSYYCGQTKRGVYKRLTDNGHHINEFPDILAIWVGSITNVDPTSDDINVVEKIMTAKMREIYGGRRMLNEVNMQFPKYNAYVINIWHKPNGDRLKKYRKYTPPGDIPDVVGHEYEKLVDAHLLFGTSKIYWTNVEL